MLRFTWVIYFMLKLKYYSLTKEEKFKLKEKFYKTEFGKSIKERLNRLLIIGILGIIFSIFLFLYNPSKWDIISGVLLLVASLIFTIGSYRVRIKKLNNFLIKNK